MYKTEFERVYIDCAKFARKDAFSLVRCIGGLRIGLKDISFEGFGVITFDPEDVQHRYPIIETLDEFKPKTNCLIYDCSKDPESHNKGVYDKLVIYQIIGKSTTAQSYGFIAWNETTGRRYHNVYINYDSHDLFSALNKTFCCMLHEDK